MSIAVPAIAALRWLAHARAPAADRQLGAAAELGFFAACVLIGGLNDWNTVVRHRVYDYAVPSELGPPALPLWMFVYWGLVLRMIATLATWRRLTGDAPLPCDRVAGRRAAGVRLAVMAVVVVVTRQLVYRLYDHPWASWLPFAIALIATAALLGMDRGDRRLVIAALVVGPAAEAALIHGPGLHRYHLGWVGGVPLWIVLWWALAVVVWRDVAARGLAVMGRGGMLAARGTD